VLHRGGNAVSAAIASPIDLAAVEQSRSGTGSDAFAINGNGNGMDSSLVGGSVANSSK
jgi:gamma-glutamyltranspeptidase